MSKLNVEFEMPDWIKKGMISGKFNIFGGVVRDNEGKIVHMLKEGQPRNQPPIKNPLILLAVTIAAGALAYYSYKRFSKRGRVLSKLEETEKAISSYLFKANEKELNIEDVKNLSSALNAFQAILEQDKYKDVKIYLSQENYNKLMEFLNSVMKFNSDIVKANSIGMKLPCLLTPQNFSEFFDQLNNQLLFQKQILEKIGI